MFKLQLKSNHWMMCPVWNPPGQRVNITSQRSVLSLHTSSLYIQYTIYTTKSVLVVLLPRRKSILSVVFDLDALEFSIYWIEYTLYLFYSIVVEACTNFIQYHKTKSRTESQCSAATRATRSASSRMGTPHSRPSEIRRAIWRGSISWE